MPSHAEELRAAATRIRTRAEKATPGPYAFDVMAGKDHESGEWWAEYWVRAAEHPSGVLVQVGSDEQAEADAEHIAAWSPEPALAVAGWLEQTAGRHGEDDAEVHSRLCLSAPAGQATVCPDMAAALLVERAVHGGGAP